MHRENWIKVVDQICSCKAVVSSSLHGLVVADTYDKPNVMLKEFELDEGDLKFKDYYFSNVIARSSKTMLDCFNSKIDIKRTGTEG